LTVCRNKKDFYFCTTIINRIIYMDSNSGVVFRNIAGIAQLVEHNLAKVGVASPSLVSRSMTPIRRVFFYQFIFCNFGKTARMVE
jgi:hypothetical protein